MRKSWNKYADLWSCLGLFLLSPLSWAEDRLVFEAQYNVAWKGWSCGTMRSQLWQKDDHSYHYSQSLKSSLFFYPFTQTEESDFSLQNGQIICKKYHVQRQGIDGPCYTVIFGEQYMEVIVSGEDEIYHYEIPGDPIHDKLVTQLILIRQILDNDTPGGRTVGFIDPEGIHYRTYMLNSQDDALIFRSDYGHKSSSFTLDPKQRYLPVLFEQYRHGALVLTGELQECHFGTAWDDFLAP